MTIPQTPSANHTPLSVRILDRMAYSPAWQRWAISIVLAVIIFILTVTTQILINNWSIPAWAKMLLSFLPSILLISALVYAFFTATFRLIRHKILLHTTGPDALRRITPGDLEHLTAAIYQAQGCKIKSRGVPGQPDGGIDLEILRDGQRGVIQCKRWSKDNVGVDKIQQLYSALNDKKADFAIFVTTSNFTEPAEKYAIDKPIELVNHGQLWEMISDARMEDEVKQRAARAASRPEIKNGEHIQCPQCGDILVLRKSIHGPFLGCRSFHETGCKTLIPIDGKGTSGLKH